MQLMKTAYFMTYKDRAQNQKRLQRHASLLSLVFHSIRCRKPLVEKSHKPI